MFRERCELSCDETLLKECGGRDRLEYARCIAGFSGYEQTDFTPGFNSGRTVERRLAAIAGMRPDGGRRAAGAAVLYASAVLVLLAAAALAAANSAALRAALAGWMERIYFTGLS